MTVMRTLRFLIVVFSLFPMSVGPAFGEFLPCRCTGGCTSLKSELPALDPAANVCPHCCHQTASTSQCDSKCCRHVPAPRQGCCCYRSPTTTVPERVRAVNELVQKFLVESVFARPETRVPAPEIIAPQRNWLADEIHLSGPPLLALFCTWLK